MNREKKTKRKKSASAIPTRQKAKADGPIRVALRIPPQVEERSLEHVARQKSWGWPPTYPPGFTPKEIERAKWVIDEAERAFREASSRLPQSPPDVVGRQIVTHDQHLCILLFDFACAVYLGFLDQAEAVLRRGEWTLSDFSVYAGSFIRDISEGLLQKFQRSATSSENKIEWRASVLVHSELVFALINSIRVRQRSTELLAAAKDCVFGRNQGGLEPSERLRTDTFNAAMDKGNPTLIEGKELVSFRTAERYLGIGERQRQSLMRRGVLEVLGKGQNRQIKTETLKQYLPPIKKPEATRSDPK